MVCQDSRSFCSRLSCVYGQATEGTILGSVQDSVRWGCAKRRSGRHNEGIGAKRQTTTDQLGEYVVTNLPLGVYTVSVEAPGFKKAVRPASA